MNVLIACVGNVLRGDDGFGVAVARALEEGELPSGAKLIETGIGGMSVVQQLADGYDALIVVDAVDRGAAPGTLFVLDPAVRDPASFDLQQWQAEFSNLHLAEPSRIFMLAKGLGVLPAKVLIVGCQPRNCDEYEQRLSPATQEAVIAVAQRVRELACELADGSAVAHGT